MRWLRWPSLVASALVIWSVWQRPDIGFALVLLGVPFTLVERRWPLRRQAPAIRRAGAGTDAVSFVVNEVVAGVGLAGLLLVVVPLVRQTVPTEFRDALATQPGWVLWAEALVVSEVSGYWGHRWSHEIPLLWRFHRVHHSAPELDWLAPNRRHPFDSIFARASTSVPVLALGFPVPTVVTYFALKRIQGLLVHANIGLRLRPLERVIATPFFHHWHHSSEPGTWNNNYAGSFPAVDWLFGTLMLPDRWPLAYGCEGDVPDAGYVRRFVSPWTTPRTRSAHRGAAATCARRARTGSASDRADRGRFWLSS